MKSSIDLYNEGYYYYTGTNMYPLNYERALDCFMQAAELGQCEAMNYVAVMYEKGEGVDKNFATALSWYEKAANAGSPFAMVTLASYYFEGRGVPKNEGRAYGLYEQAYAINQHPTAAYYLGCQRMNHKKYIDAAKLFKQAAENGKIPEAWHNLGVLIANHGIRIGKADPKLQAAMSYKSAAELGYAPSMFNYALTVISIAGGPNNEAMHWLEKAADMGFEPAKKRLKAIRFSRSGSLFDLLG